VNSVQFNLTFQFVNLKMRVMGITERKTRQKQALRERILDAARRIVVREGFAALSMRKIADAIEYSPATLYLHFASRDEIARALCAEGYAQLLSSFEPLAHIADPAERLKALGRAYIAFGVEHPETYRLIFMEDPSYMGAALGGPSSTGAQRDQALAAQPENAEADAGASAPADETPAAGSTMGSGAEASAGATSQASIVINPAAGHESGDAAMRLILGTLEELKAAGRFPVTLDGAVVAEAFWASLHGIVALNLTCPVFPSVPLDALLDVTLTAWFGESQPGGSAASASGAGPVAGKGHTPRKPKPVGA
jgi:AcrR family transcriptional regulator